MDGIAGEAPEGVRVVVYKQLLPGDYRKLEARSNDSATGGGARDLRFPFGAFDDVFRRLLPRQCTKLRRRGARRDEVELRTGPVYLDVVDVEGNVVDSRAEEMVWEPPTDPRPTEGRIAKVHASAATVELLAARDPTRGEAFALFVQDDHGQLRVHWAFEEDLRTGKWASAVATPILQHLDERRSKTRAVQGYIDFTQNFWYPHGIE
jgi:hypothetical protein